jgi:hypothetical protein
LLTAVVAIADQLGFPAAERLGLTQTMCQFANT